MKNSKEGNRLFRIGNYFRFGLLLLMTIAFNNVNAQQNLITGTVVDSDGMPLPSVNITIDGTTNGAQTDFDGNFSINASPQNTLSFSYVGMENVSILIGTQTKIDVVMVQSAESLDEVVVIGYGTRRKSDMISSVASVAPEEMVKVATADTAEMLRGKTAGVQVTLSDGGPGSSSNILIRGKNSINGGNDPLVIADGVPVGNINDINPNDIESLEILKDAAAQAIYGARASNGVILITTKRGKGKARVDYTGYTGVSTYNRNFDIYSGDEFAQLKREAFRGANLGEYQPDENIFSDLELASVQNGEYIDWEDEILNTGFIQNHNLSVSSGTEKTNVYTSFNYLNQTGVIPNSDYNRVSARINVDQQINDWLKVGVNTSIQWSNEERPNVGGILLTSVTTSPLGQVYNEDGSLRYLPGGFEENKNPLIDIYETSTESYNRNDIVNVFLDITPFKGFSYRLNASRRSWNGKSLSYNTAESVSGTTNGGLGNGGITFQDNVEWQLENIFNYKVDLKDDRHNLDLLGVQSMTESKYNRFYNQSRGIPNDILGIYGLEAAETNTPFISGNRRALLSGVVRAEYSFDSRYYFVLAGRADGSSVFGDNNKWGFFPSAAASWNAHNEEFLQDNSTINNLKFSVSYGSVGNEGISPYQSLSTALQRDYIIDGVKVSGYVPGDFLPNPDLKWETSTTLNAKVDVGLWSNRLTATAEYYNTRTKDLLIDQALNAGLGYSRKKTNIGEVENQGFEFSVNGALVRNKDLKINLGLNFSKNTNKIISLYGLDEDGDGIEDDDVGNSWFIGEPIDVYYRYMAVGIFQEGEDIASTHQPNALPGDIKLFDRFPDDGELNAENDRVLSSRVPDWFGTLNFDLEYKWIDFSFALNTVQGVIRDNPFLYGYNEGGSLRGIKNGIKQDYWLPENPGGNFPRPNEANDPVNGFALGLQDASYVRLQNVTLGYSFQENFLTKTGFSKLRLYFSGNNLFTITDFESYSPEKNPNEYPEAVTYVFGLQFGF